MHVRGSQWILSVPMKPPYPAEVIPPLIYKERHRNIWAILGIWVQSIFHEPGQVWSCQLWGKRKISPASSLYRPWEVVLTRIVRKSGLGF